MSEEKKPEKNEQAESKPTSAEILSWAKCVLEGTETGERDNATSDKLDEAADKALEVITELKDRDNKKIEIQEAQIQVLSDIAVTLNAISITLGNIDVDMRHLVKI